MFPEQRFRFESRQTEELAELGMSRSMSAILLNGERLKSGTLKVAARIAQLGYKLVRQLNRQGHDGFIHFTVYLPPAPMQTMPARIMASAPSFAFVIGSLKKSFDQKSANM